jgi:hypothetical protein
MADKKLRTLEDLERVVRALAREFQTDEVFIIGSQAILASMPDAPDVIVGNSIRLVSAVELGDALG